MIREYIKNFDKFTIDGHNLTIHINFDDFESEEHFISRVEKIIESLDKHPDKIIYTGKEIILVVR